MDKYQLRVAGAGTVIGANAGVYNCLTDNPGRASVMNQYLKGITVGGFIGGCAGLVFPVFLPLVAVGAPGYLAFKARSALQESQQKAGKQAA